MKITVPSYHWFGTDWGAPANKPALQVDVPVGATCVECLLVFAGDDSGVRVPLTGERSFSHYHRACFWRAISGIST